MNEIVKDVTKIINFIKGHALLHREFNSFLEEIDPDLTSLLYYTEVRCLSKGKMAAWGPLPIELGGPWPPPVL